jgi:hypothetical protein
MGITSGQIELIDEFGKLDAWLQSVQRDIRRHGELKDQIKSWFDGLPGEQEETVRGNVYEIQVGQKSIEKRWIKMSKVYSAVGRLSTFLSIATITFKALSGVIGEEKAKALQVEERTGSRRLKAFRRADVSAQQLKAA